MSTVNLEDCEGEIDNILPESNKLEEDADASVSSSSVSPTEDNSSTSLSAMEETQESSEVPNSPSSSKGPPIPITLKWMGKEFPIDDIGCIKNVRELKSIFREKTGVLEDRQKLLNVTFKGKIAGDEVLLAHVNLKSGQRVMMMGSLEKEIETVDVPPEDRPEVSNDLDLPEGIDEAFETNEIYLSKIERRVREYEINEINPPREGKKLLVLDIDYTLFDHLSVAETGAELMRPYLHEFLTDAYEDFDIAIWSASSMKWIVEKMKLLGISSNTNYKILFYMDYLAMISVHTQKYGVKEVKPLGVIWGKYPQYNRTNTIMIDDCRRNFLMNPKNGLKCRPFRQAHLNRDKDKELSKLSRYLRIVARVEDITTLNHHKWEHYCNKRYMSKRRAQEQEHQQQ